jgi:integrase
MTRKHPELPEGYFPKGRWFYRVRAEGSKRVWVKISLIRDGLPAFYRKLSEMAADGIAPGRIPAVIGEWQTEVQPERAKKTQEGDEWVMGAIAEAFAEFRAPQVTTPLCVEFLKDYRDRPRTHNLMRTGLLELFRFCEFKGYRQPGSNPVPPIPRMKTPPRKKYATDSELRRIKHAALVGKDGLQTRSGPMICALVDMAYLTGQRVGDLLDLRWTKRAATNAAGEVVAPHISDDAIYFQPDKTAGTTGAKVAITWTPKLRELVERIKAIGRRHLTHVFTNQDAQPLVYSTFATAWWRACDRAGIKDLHFHDIRAKAITDTDETHGRQAANRKGAHATEKQTADYIRHRKARKTEATR